MQAFNNIYYIEDKPVARYKTCVPYAIAGKRMDPRSKDIAHFILGAGAHVDFNYNQHVLEVYSEIEDRFIKDNNPRLFEEGALVPYTESAEVHRSFKNALSDEDVMQIASMRNADQLQKRLDTITSKIAVQRIFDAAKELGRSSRILEVLESKLKSFDGGVR